MSTMSLEAPITDEDEPQELPTLDSSLLEGFWSDFSSQSEDTDFREFVEARSNQDYGDFSMCEDCDEPVMDDDVHTVHSMNTRFRMVESNVCESCRDNNYQECDNCSEVWNSDNIHNLSAGDVCQECYDNVYYFCESCDEHYHEDYSGEHQHEDEDETEGCCEAQHQTFTMRNDGEDPLQNDTRVTITLPTGIIDSRGIDRMADMLRENNYRSVITLLPLLGNEWTTKDGNFTKRLSRMAYKNLSVKVNADVLSGLGNIGREHSTTSSAYAVEITRNLNLSAAAFGHRDSCWWGGYGSSRCSLKSNGGLGLRTFDAAGNVTGRAWVQPVKLKDGVSMADANGSSLEATSDTLNADGFLVYNGYGDMGGYVPARIIGHMSGMTYRKVGLHLSPQYVNNGNGYLVAPEALAVALTNHELDVYVPRHR